MPDLGATSSHIKCNPSITASTAAAHHPENSPTAVVVRTIPYKERLNSTIQPISSVNWKYFNMLQSHITLPYIFGLYINNINNSISAQMIVMQFVLLTRVVSRGVTGPCPWRKKIHTWYRIRANGLSYNLWNSVKNGYRRDLLCSLRSWVSTI